MRSAAEGAEHAHGAVTRTLGDDEWPKGAGKDEYVQLYVNKLEENTDFTVINRAMESPRNRRVRFDLVFASSNRTAVEIMTDIMNQDDLWDKANDELGQSGLGDF
jgi:hypothetical protein